MRAFYVTYACIHIYIYIYIYLNAQWSGNSGLENEYFSGNFNVNYVNARDDPRWRRLDSIKKQLYHRRNELFKTPLLQLAKKRKKKKTHAHNNGSCKNLGEGGGGKKKNYNCFLGQVIVSGSRSSNIQCGAPRIRHASRRETKIIQPNQFFRCLIKISCRPPLHALCRREFFHGSTNDPPLPVSRGSRV